MLKENDRVIVTDGLNQQPLGVIRRGRNNTLQPGDMSEDGVKRLRMLCGGAEARAYHGANHQRRNRLTAEHVTKFGGLVIDLIETDAHEIDKHQFRPPDAVRQSRRRSRPQQKRIQ